MAYLNSDNIKMYPSAYRAGNRDKFAQLNTEFNLTHTKLLSQYDNNNNYSYENGDYLIIYLHGYYFNILETAIKSISHTSDNDDLYAAIKIATYSDTEVLVNYEADTSTTLDNPIPDTSDYEFQGLCITDTLNGIGDYYIKIAEWQTTSWNIVTQPLKLSTTEIRNGISSDNSIAVDLNTQNLRFTNILDNINSKSIFIGNGNDNNIINFLPKTTGNITQKVVLGDVVAPFEAIIANDITIKQQLVIFGQLTLKDSENKQILVNGTIDNGSNSHRVITIGDSSIDTANDNAFIIRPFKTDNNQAVVNIGETNNKINALFAQTINASNATIASSVSAQTFIATSDVRLKENIEDYKCEKSILDLPIKQFDFKTSKQHSIGCIAQDLKEICPEIVHENEEGYLTIEENKLIYLLIQEVKELKEEIKRLK